MPEEQEQQQEQQPTVEQLQAEIAAERAKLEEARAQAEIARRKLADAQPILEYLNKPGVVEAVEETMKNGGVPPAQAPAAQGLPEDVADMTIEQLQAVVQQTVQAAIKPVTETVEQAQARLQAQEMRQAILQRTGLTPDEYSKIEQEYAKLSPIERAELAVKAYKQKSGAPPSEQPGQPATPPAGSNLPGGAAVSPGQPAHTKTEIDKMQESFETKVLARRNDLMRKLLKPLPTERGK